MVDGEGNEEVFVIQRPKDVAGGGKGKSGMRDIELDERGVTPTTPTTMGRGMESSAESLGFHHGGEET
jgi:hypothetical protein